VGAFFGQDAGNFLVYSAVGQAALESQYQMIQPLPHGNFYIF
jgi:hypothetical protein